jgi:23S rRNA (cytosine1962-C5)-methyltransferase
VKENGLPWLVVPGEGQKTGLYCDQRDNRRYVQRFADGARVLDAFCYHGGFGLHALHGGAEFACFADASADALEMVRSNGKHQGVDDDRYQCVQGDLFEMLRKNAVPGGLESYNLIVLDPPKLAPARRNVQDGLRAYKDLHLSVFRYASAGTRVVTFSCSGAVAPQDFRRAVAWAAADCGRDVAVEDILTQSSDHPVPLSFPEAEYLKGLVIYIRNTPSRDSIRRP